MYVFCAAEIKENFWGKRDPKYLLILPGFLLIAMDWVIYLSRGKDVMYRLWEIALQAWIEATPFSLLRIKRASEPKSVKDALIKPSKYTVEDPKAQRGLFAYCYLTSVIHNIGDFPGGPVVKTLCFQCRVQGFEPWSGN